MRIGSNNWDVEIYGEKLENMFWIDNSRNWFFFLTTPKVIYNKYSKHSNETNTFMGLGRAGRLGRAKTALKFKYEI